MVTPIVSNKYRYLYQLFYLKIFSTNYNIIYFCWTTLAGRVRSQITSVDLVCQIQRFDFDCNLLVIHVATRT
jgi:hypothetical protein